MAKTVKTICNILLILIVVVTLFIAGTLFVPYLFGYQPMAVLSGSMEPDIPVGSIIFVKETPVDDIKIGDDITFKTGNLIVTHRVIEINEKDQAFTTQGTANKNTVDTVPYGSMIGRAAKFCIPAMGVISEFIKTPLGIITACAIVLIVILLIFIPDLFVKKAKEDSPISNDEQHNPAT